MKKNIVFFRASFIAVMVVVCLSGVAYAYDLANIDLFVLTLGKKRTVTRELSRPLPDAFHLAWILTVGEGTLSISIKESPPLVGEAEILFGTSGFIGATPVVATAYGSGAGIAKQVPVPAAGFGAFLTGIIEGGSGTDYPVTMSITFELKHTATK
jgi:hypothetical protein